MGLREDIQTDIGQAFDTDLADAVKTISLVQSVNSYDPETGVNTTAETVTATRGVLDAFFNNEVFDTSLEPTNVVAIILVNELNATPEIDDYIQSGAIRYKVRIVKKDPADAHWELTCQL